jgi:hypothetical protein
MGYPIRPPFAPGVGQLAEHTECSFLPVLFWSNPHLTAVLQGECPSFGAGTIF